MVKKHIIRRVRHVFRRLASGRTPIRKILRAPAKQTETKHVKRPSDLPENPITGIPHPHYQDKSPKDGGWRNT
jgi:hypothetical protein